MAPTYSFFFTVFGTHHAAPSAQGTTYLFSAPLGHGTQPRSVSYTHLLALTTAVNAGGTSYKKGNKVTFGIVTTDGVKGLNYTTRLYNDKLWKLSIIHISTDIRWKRRTPIFPNAW